MVYIHPIHPPHATHQIAEEPDEHEESGLVQVLVLGGDRPAKASSGLEAPIDINVVTPPSDDGAPSPAAATAAPSAEGDKQGQHERRRSRSLEEGALQQPPPLQPQSKSMVISVSGSAPLSSSALPTTSRMTPITACVGANSRRNMAVRGFRPATNTMPT